MCIRDRLEGVSYEESVFEGYGPGGVAIIVDCLTDNNNRTTSFVRSTFDKYGGNLGTPGCVSYMFSRKGIILIEKEDSMDEDAIMAVSYTHLGTRPWTYTFWPQRRESP